LFHPNIITDTTSADVFVTINSETFNQQDFQYTQQLSEILKDSGESNSVFQLGNLTIKTNKLKEYTNDLIKL
jgi:hypothetical protein